jgi:hypothetical protein
VLVAQLRDGSQARRNTISIVSTSWAPGTGQAPSIRKKGTPVIPSS